MLHRRMVFLKIGIFVSLVVVAVLMSQNAAQPLITVLAQAGKGQVTCGQTSEETPKNLLKKFKLTGHDASISLDAPASLKAELDIAVGNLTRKEDKPVDKADKLLNFRDTNYAFAYDTAQVKVIAVPLDKSGKVDPDGKDFTSTDGKDVKIVGAIYAPAISDKVLIVTAVTNSTEIRLYDVDGNQVTTQKAVLSRRDFKEATNDKAIPTDGDLGVKIAEQETCFTYSDRQACVQIPLGVESKATDAINTADKALDSVINYSAEGVSFDKDHIVADLFGDAQRKACSNAMPGYPFGGGSVQACKPTMVLAAPNITSLDASYDKALPTLKNYPDCRVIGLMHLDSDATVDSQGNSNKGEVYNTKTSANRKILPKADYLMFTTDPTAKPGDPTPIFLIDAAGNSFIIPGIRVEAFGVVSQGTKDNNSKYSAFIKDGGTGGTGMP